MRQAKRRGLGATCEVTPHHLLLADKTASAIYLFSAVMGVLWLSTVPLTSGIVAQVFGLRFMATLFGIVFLSHQVGSFIGIWLGGVLYEIFGNYNAIWIAGAVLGLIAAVLHWPIKEQSHVGDLQRVSVH